MVKAHYFYDPMCGWCYGATPLMEVVAAHPGIELHYHPGGMLDNRLLETGMRQHIIQSDQRIGQETGQVFGDRYLNRLQSAEPVVLDSYLPTRALLVAKDMGLDTFAMLKAIQSAHYQQGRNVNELETLLAIAVAMGAPSDSWLQQMARADQVLTSVISQSHSLMQTHQVGGFPTLMIEREHGRWKKLPLNQFYRRPADWQQYLTQALSA
ncbi:DsbA family protein [Photobacterium ganghwense]|uniref:DsbA family protein n=1 Tax=Photobacterium ganghwense TaxID=320778 RepID=UPI0039F14BF5